MSKFTFIRAEKASFPVAVMCSVLDVSRSGFYAWCTRPKSSRKSEDERLALAVQQAHKAGRGAYGTRRIHHALKKAGWRVGRKRIARLRRQEGLSVKRRRRYIATTNSEPTQPVAANVLQRNFEVSQPNKVWVTDVTHVWTLEGWVYLAVILDLCTRRVVGWAMNSNNDRHLALAALERAAMLRRPAPGWMHHSDRGAVYTSLEYRIALERLGARVSMSRKGNCWDNAVAESFFASLKGECLDHIVLYTRAQAIALTADYIDAFYNICRMHSTLNYESPIEFELKLQSRREAA